jgi:hypothetical protein
MLEIVSTYAAGGEEAVKATSGQAATLLLEHLQQDPREIGGQALSHAIDEVFLLGVTANVGEW